MKKNSVYRSWKPFIYPLILGIYLNSISPTLAHNPFPNNNNNNNNNRERPQTKRCALVPLRYDKQQNQISGTITDGTSPLPGVTISIKGKRNNTVSSNFNGQYTLTATATDTLMVSFIGFKSTIVPINGRKTVNIQLQEDITSLQEVHVNAGYYTVKESERTGSISKITAKDIETQPVNNPLAAMQGRMSGVNIIQSTGIPGGGFNIQIRGINSIRSDGNEPLYVVNGLPYSSQSLGDSTIASTAILGVTNPLNNLNPADIESIVVLKDADATAIYGSRGANGVVLITTKKGKAGETKFNINASTTVGKITRTIDLMHTPQYLAMRAEAFSNDGITQYPDDAYDSNGTWDQNRYTDWKKELIGGTAFINNVQTSISGGNPNTQYLLSGTYRKETTVFPGESYYRKGAAHSSITHKSDNKRFYLNFSADYSSDKNTLPGRDLTANAYALAPNAPALYDAAGNLNWEHGTFNNPLAYLQATYLNSMQNLIANTLLTYKVLPDLELKTSLGYNNTSVSQSYTRPTSMFNPFDNSTHEASLYLNTGNGKSWIFEPQLSYEKRWGKTAMNFLIGTTFQNQKTTQLAQSGSGFTTDALINNLDAAARVSVLNHRVVEYNYTAGFARLNLNFKEKYFINLTGRRDGSSRFGPQNRFANFAAIGVAWLVSNESFLKNNGVLSFAKFRGSYGITGNDQIGDYQYLDTYEVSRYLYDGVIGLTPARLFNPNFGWETNKKIEVAIELGFLNDNIFLTVAYFKNRSASQLVGVPLPGTTGFASIQSNLDATVQNTGFELELRTVNFRKKDFSWTTTLNLTVPKNKLMAFPNLESSTYANSLVVGESLFIKKVFNYTGIDPDSGAYTFQDYNGDGQITFDSDRQKITDTAPQYYGGFGNQLSYKNWGFDFLFQYVRQQGKNYLYSSSLAGTVTNQPVEIGNHFPINGTGAIAQQYTTGDNSAVVDAFYNFIESDAAFSDASFIRLKSVNLSYTIPSEWSKTFTGRVYLQTQNLFTFTHYRGADPENQSTTTVPPLRQFTLGFQLGF
ncbi:SusC/RagA family TonB-linked outer membrane protein [Flavobacterium petrolei]|uniref:SusC/RagA family TonB-linked outer membrane protein n=1 Tax=Flavobacterium petrolei TaxID=2259594 RepID=UPI0037565CE8